MADDFAAQLDGLMYAVRSDFDRGRHWQDVCEVAAVLDAWVRADARLAAAAGAIRATRTTTATPPPLTEAPAQPVDAGLDSMATHMQRLQEALRRTGD